LSERLPPVDVKVVDEFVRNYDPADGSSSVQGHIVGIDEMVLSKALYLPVSETSVGGDLDSDFVPVAHFKTGEDAYEKGQGWKIAEALTPELNEWFRFVQRRLAMKTHVTYMAKKLLFAAIWSFEGMVFNWAAYVSTGIHKELETKRKSGKIATLLCSNYVCEAVRYQLKEAAQGSPPTPQGKEGRSPQATSSKGTEAGPSMTQQPMPPPQQLMPPPSNPGSSKGKALMELPPRPPKKNVPSGSGQISVEFYQ